MIISTHAFNAIAPFLSEQRSESYGCYDERVAQQKIVLGVKNTLQGQACTVLGRYVA